MPTWLVPALQGVGVVAAVGAAALAVRAYVRRKQHGVAGRLASIATDLNVDRPRSVSPTDRKTPSQRIEDSLARFGWAQRLRRMIDVSTIPIGVGDLLLLTALLAVAAFLVARAIGLTWLPATGVTATCGIAPFVVLFQLRRRWESRVALQLPDAIDLITRALRAGHSLQTGLQLVGDEMPEPIRGVFRRTHAELSLGARMEHALTAMGERVGSKDLDIFVSALLIHRQVGGDLAEMLDKLAFVVRERIRLARKIRALTAEGRLSGVILCLAPVAVFAMLLLLNPRYPQMLLKHSTGPWLLAAAAALQFAGSLMIRRIVSLKP